MNRVQFDTDKPLAGLSILCADDEPVSLQILAEILHAAGATVRIASNGKRALELLKTHSVDCVLMDIMMPEIDGLTAIRTIRAQGSQILIIAVTGAAKMDAANIIEAGADAYLSKPVMAADLIELINLKLSDPTRPPMT